MLFQHLLEPGDRVVVEQPSYDRTLLLLERLGVERVAVPLEADGIDVDGSRRRSPTGPIEARPRDPQLPQPGRLHALGGEARAAGRARRRARLLDLRGRPLPRAAVRGRAAADDARARPRPGRVIHASSFSKTVSPGVRVGYLVGPGRRRSPSSPSAPTRPTSRRTCSPSRSSSSSAAPAASTRTSTSSRARCGSAVTPWSRRSASRSPRRSSSSPAAATSSGSTSTRAPTRAALLAAAKEEGVAFVAGPDFMLEGGENSLRLSFASVPPEQIAEGVARIARALERVRAGTPA